MQPRMEINNLAANELAIKHSIPKDYVYAESDCILILSYVTAQNAGDSNGWPEHSSQNRDYCAIASTVGT
ncbi:MAG: hypothetical protein STSR0001_03160 [Methanothrix sp.]